MRRRERATSKKQLGTDWKHVTHQLQSKSAVLRAAPGQHREVREADSEGRRSDSEAWSRSDQLIETRIKIN